MQRMKKKLAEVEAKMGYLQSKEEVVRARSLLGQRVGYVAGQAPPPMPAAPTPYQPPAVEADPTETHAEDLDGDGVVTAAELAEFTRTVQEQAQAKHSEYRAAIGAVKDEGDALEAQVASVRESMRAGEARLSEAQKKRLEEKRAARARRS